MADPVTPAATDPAPTATTHPWGDDFDAATAWRLVQNLRGENTTLKGERDEARTERDTLKTDAETASTRAQEAEGRATQAERKLIVDKAIRAHKLPDGYEDFLTGDTEEEILAKAERLAGIKPPSEPAPADPATPAEPAAPGTTRPEPALTPGHGGTAAAPFDPDAVAKAARRS